MNRGHCFSATSPPKRTPLELFHMWLAHQWSLIAIALAVSAQNTSEFSLILEMGRTDSGTVLCI